MRRLAGYRPTRWPIGLASVAALAVLVLTPAVAKAGPRWFINGKLAEAKHEAVVSQGAITLQNQMLPKVNCLAIAPGAVWNSSEKGLGATEAAATYGCKAEPACAGVFISDERPVEVVERKREHEPVEEPRAVLVPGPLPWEEEATEEGASEKHRELKIERLLITIVMPCLNLEVPFEGKLEPLLVNGIKNGLSPSHLQFQGKGGQTGFLTTAKFGSGEENSRGYLSGELTMVGGNVELVTAE